MTAEQNPHQARVEAWLARALVSAPAGATLDVFEAALASVWRRARRTLGGLTVVAIMERVLYEESLRFSWLSALKIDAAGLSFSELRGAREPVPDEQVKVGLSVVLSSFLTLLGSVTDETLTVALHSELPVSVLSEAGRSAAQGDSASRNAEPTAEESEP